MREMKDSGVPWIGEIPNTWRVFRNKNVFSCSKDIVGGDFASTQLLSLTTKGIKLKSQDATGGKVPESFETYQLVRKQQLVMCLFDLDCSAVFSGLSPYDGMISPAYKVLDCIGVSPVFADYWFSFVFDNRKFKHYAKNLRYTLNYDEFAVLPIVCPSIEHQRRIADFLDAKCAEIDAILENTRASIEEYKALKMSVITESVTKGIRGERPMRDSGVEWIEEIPTEWDVLGFYRSNYIRGRLGWKGLKADEYVSEGYPFLSAFNIIENHLDWSELNYITQERYDESPEIKLSVGDLLIVKDGAGIGKCARIDELPLGEATVNSSLAVITPSERFDHRYEYYYMQSAPFQHVIWFLKIGMGVPHLTQEKMREISIPCPTLDEQEEIAAYLDEKCATIDSLIASKEALIAELEAYKKSIIYEYVTGKKEVPAV